MDRTTKDETLQNEHKELRNSLQWIVTFCEEHHEWFNGGSNGNLDDGAEFVWLNEARQLLNDIKQ